MLNFTYEFYVDVQNPLSLGCIVMKRKILLVGIGALVLVTALLVMVLTKKSHRSDQKG